MNGATARRGFTLVELLVTIAIIAILFVVAAVVINPFQLLQQSRDAERVSDLSTINGALTLYQSQQRGLPGYSMGSTNTAYLSVADITASSTAGNQCTGLGMPTSTGYAYHCAQSPSDLSTGTGWLPVNFAALPSGLPFKSLPVDPTNQTSSNLYYTYETDGAKWALSAFFESQKYAKNGQATGGIDPSLYEVGPGIATLPEGGRGLIGYWPLNEGAGSVALDWSGSNHSAQWYGNMTNGSYYAAGKPNQFAGTFDGATTYVQSTSSLATVTSFTFSAWVYSTTTFSRGFVIWLSPADIELHSQNIFLNRTGCGATAYTTSNPYTAGSWHMLAVSWNGSSATIYMDGTPLSSTFNASCTLSSVTIGNTTAMIGKYTNFAYFAGLISDARIYNRVLSASEIQQIYNAEK